jgi:hypothetical protein
VEVGPYLSTDSPPVNSAGALEPEGITDCFKKNEKHEVTNPMWPAQQKSGDSRVFPAK